MNKKGQTGSLIGIGIVLVMLTVIIIIGMTIGTNLTKTAANCIATQPYDTATGYCTNSSGTTFGTGGANAVSGYALSGYLGTSSGGLGSWIPTIIAIVIGALAIALIAGGFGKKQY